jgi:hypothetical protein
MAPAAWAGLKEIALLLAGAVAVTRPWPRAGREGPRARHGSSGLPPSARTRLRLGRPQSQAQARDDGMGGVRDCGFRRFATPALAAAFALSAFRTLALRPYSLLVAVEVGEEAALLDGGGGAAGGEAAHGQQAAGEAGEAELRARHLQRQRRPSSRRRARTPAWSAPARSRRGRPPGRASRRARPARRRGAGWARGRAPSSGPSRGCTTRRGPTGGPRRTPGRRPPMAYSRPAAAASPTLERWWCIDRHAVHASARGSYRSTSSEVTVSAQSSECCPPAA